MNVEIDGVRYHPEQLLEKRAMELLNEIYGSLWAEAFYDPFNDSTQKFAIPLSEKMTELNAILHFKK
jgi:hypothetical protein